nr:MAG TPA: Photosynthetic reaction center cytochrome c-RC, photosynthesis, purple bacteria [Caudoviricetes sp.]
MCIWLFWFLLALLILSAVVLNIALQINVYCGSIYDIKYRRI